jgi:hypothetical protein
MEWLSRLFRKKTVRNNDDQQGNKESTISSPYKDLSPEREKEMIEWVTEKIHAFKMEVPATFLFQIYKPISTILSDLAMISGYPVILEFFNIKGFEWTSFFRKKGNIDALLNKLEQGN